MKFKRVLATFMIASLIANTATIGVKAESSDGSANVTAQNESSGAEQTGQENEFSETDKKAEKNEDVSEKNENTNISGTTEIDENESTSVNLDAAEQMEVSEQTGALSLSQVVDEEGITCDRSGDKITSVTINANTSSDGEAKAAGQIIKISNCNPEDLENLEIKTEITGSVDLTGKYDGLTYNGIGTADTPFKGKFDTGKAVFIINKPLFGTISSSATVNVDREITWKGTDPTLPLYADEYIFQENKVAYFPCTIKGDSGSTMGTVIKKVTSDPNGFGGTLKIANQINYDNATIQVKSTSDAGLICNTLDENLTIQLDGYKLPTNLPKKNDNNNIETVKADSGNAGGLIGTMNKNTKLSLDSEAVSIGNLQVITDSGNAGALVGEMLEGSQFEYTSDKDIAIETPYITGTKNAGGLIGYVQKVNLSRADEKTGKIVLSNPIITRKTERTGNAGGLIGTYILDNQTLEKPDWITINSKEEGSKLTSEEKVDLNIENGSSAIGNGNAGGLFGVLELKNDSNYTISDVKICSRHAKGGVGTYGAIAGQVKSDTGTENSLYINNVKVYSIHEDTNPYFHSGLIGQLGETGDKNKAAYLEIKDAEILVDAPYAGNPDEPGFGGAVGRVAEKSIVKTEGTIKVSTGGGVKNDPRIWEGGGLIGNVMPESVVELNGETDLTGVTYAPLYGVGQLVGKQSEALIYARGDGTSKGWIYKRTEAENIIDQSSNKGSLDDIGNYGQVIRLKGQSAETGLSDDLIQMDKTTHQVSLKQSDDCDDTNIILNNTDEFALMAITWQSRGRFSAYSDVTADNWITLAGKNITLKDSINLTGTGITGLTRDNADDEATPYTGIFDGGSKIITLATGEAYGYQGEKKVEDNTNSGGKDHRRTNIGIFAAVNGGEVKNLTIQGNVYAEAVPKNRDTGNSNWICHIGGYASEISGDNSEVKINNVDIKASINVSRESIYNRVDAVYVGGVIGQSKGNNVTIQLGNEKEITIEPKITIEKTGADYVFAGGVIGSLESSKTVMVNCDSVSLAGTMESKSSYNAQIGGLIGLADYDEQGTSKIVNIKDIDVNGQKIIADDATDCGGLLGFHWANTDVNFIDSKEDSKYALEVNGKTCIKAAKASAGGLLYRGSGKWTVNDHGINISGGDFDVKNLGLLVCYAAKDESQIDSSGNPIGYKQKALYLEMTENWETAYKLDGITVGTSINTYDELIAYTAKDAESITNNNNNGIVSLATKNRKGVNLDSASESNTYRNRVKNKTNPCSRYYYNLDEVMVSDGMKNDSDESGLNTPEKLLMWSVWKYAGDNLKKYFETVGEFDANKKTVVGTWNNDPVKLDMEGFSYYPINIGWANVNNAKIVFHNKEIEQLENDASNKKTTGNKTDHTQHYMMHCGLFYNMWGSKTETEDIAARVSKTEFSGTIGKVNGGSGVLCCGTIEGVEDKKKFYTVDITDEVKLAGVVVAGADKQNDDGYPYAPVLINSVSSYATLNLNDISAEYEENTIAGSSLIGNAGDRNTTQISLTFNKMKLADKTVKNGGIFTHSSFLESFQYKDNGVGTAIYTFDKEEDWEETNHIHNVTYGQEISDSYEYSEKQRWYYNLSTYRTEKGYVQDEDPTLKEPPSFSKYLPYVAIRPDEETNGQYHEIMVNQRVSNMEEGCGTYGHPYKITSAFELNTISDYLSSGIPRENWKVNITNDQSLYEGADGQEDRVYEYKNLNKEWKWVHVQEIADGKWENAEDADTTILPNTVMHRYLLSAYYDLRGEETSKGSNQYQIELDNFNGFGNELYPFRGVLTSTNKNGCTLVLRGSGGARGLISYSYGSVVQNLTVNYKGTGKTVSYEAEDVPATADADNLKFESKAVFGGVIGYVIGGDNIIDNVKVTMDSDWKLQLEGSAKHLIQAGGYVGSVSGGGVIFRNMSGFAGLSNDNLKDVGDKEGVSEDATKSLYVNPYVGRVLDGYAFSEGCKVENGNKNYKINELDTSDTSCITTNYANGSYNVGMSDAQGLLIMSALINSGGTAGGNTYTYKKDLEAGSSVNGYSFGNGIYGKVRNAKYNHISEKDSVSEDFATAVNDDRNAPGEGNAPYLMSQYGNNAGAAFNLCGTEDGKTIFNLTATGDKEYDMTGYGNGYQGISARYMSSALEIWDGTNSKVGLGLNYAKPLLAGFNGNNCKVIVDMQIKEYADDDFHGVSYGGIFNIVHAAAANELENNTLVKELTIGTEKQQENNKKAIVSLQYYNADGATVDSATNLEEESGLYCVGVGGFAGNTSANSMGEDTDKTKYYFCKVKIQNGEFKGPNSAGGLFGSVGMGGVNEVNKGIGMLLRNSVVNENNKNRNSMGINLENCQYADLTVTSPYASGGFVGYLTKNNTDFYDTQGSSIVSSMSVTEASCQVVADDSTIKATDKIFVDQNSKVNPDFSVAGGIFGKVDTSLEVNTGENTKKAILNDITVDSQCNVGGVLGHIESNSCEINNITVQGTSKITGLTNAGGIAGYVKSNNTKTIFKNCYLINGEIEGGNRAKSNVEKAGIGGIAGIIQTGTWSNITGKIVLEDCGVSADDSTNANLSPNVSSKVKITSGADNAAGAGGILGYMTGHQNVVIQRCNVKDTLINSGVRKAYNGGILGTMEHGNEDYCKKEKLSLYDLSVTDTEIYGTETGGLTSSMYGSLEGSNIQLNNVKVYGVVEQRWPPDTRKVGILVGGSGSSSRVEHLYLAGVSIKGTTWTDIEDEKSWTRLTDDGGSFNFGTNAFISFADYTGAASGAQAGTEKKELLGQTGTPPYVTTSPVSSLSVLDEKNEKKNLFGDGAGWTEKTEKKDETTTTTYETIGEKIYKENTGTFEDTFYYTYQGADVTGFTANNAISTYNSNQKEGVEKDFPVLKITGGDTGNIEKYLNIVTNGGYSQAKGQTGRVSYSVRTYSYDSESKKFKDNGTATTLNVNNGEFQVSSEYDNDNNRFTLLTVTFTASEDHVQQVQIPIIVRRVMEVDFTATLSYGTNFKKENYDTLTNHVLDSFDNAMTAYLTYKYNSAFGKDMDYGWESYINSGGNVAGAMEKVINFNDSLPKGTQLTLINCQDTTKKAYYYTADEDNQEGKFEFSQFKDSKGKSFASSSIGELIGVKVTPDNSGTFVEASSEEEATVCYDGKYYRLPKAGEDVSTQQKYLVTIDKTKKCEENYYLVITVPNQEGQSPINGRITTELDGNIPYNINQLLRNTTTPDRQGNTASTFQLSGGYKQELSETITRGEAKVISAADSTVKVSLQDEITVPEGQYYNEEDELYQSFTGMLQSGNSEQMNAVQFPSGTNGEAKFYVYTEKDGVKTYYKWNKDNWSTTTDEDPVAIRYEWESDGGNMELPLSTDGSQENAISLRKIRELSEKLNNKFWVEAKLDAAIPANGLSVIPESTLDTGTNIPKAYAKMNYISKLSTEKQSLSYTNTKKTLTDTAMKYYREKTDGAKLTYDADNISQLGINLLDLEYNLDKDKEHAVIDTTATYSLADIEDLSDKLKNSTGVEFTLSVKEKNTAEGQTESYNEQNPIDAKDDYMDIKIVSKGSTEPTYTDNTWTWRIEKDQYWDSRTNMLKTDNVVFNGDTFSQAIRLLVKVDNVENDNHEYSNYKVVLTAKVLGVNGTDKSDYIIYTLTRIKPEFVD